MSTAILPVEWAPELRNPVQWDNRLQDILEAVMRAAEEARRGEGRTLTDADLATDDDDG